MSRVQRGAAFLIVMWLLALLAIILGSFALLARSERLQARHLYDTTQARYAAEAGVHRAVFAMAMPDPTQRWVPDGRPYTFQFDQVEIEVEITDETGKIDLNTVDVTVLAQFFIGFELSLDEANALAAAIIDWRDTDDLVTLNGAELDDYEAAGLSYGPRNAPFEVLGEVQQVLGMNYALYEQVAPYLTIYSGLSMPNPSFAAAPVLQALPGMDPALAEQALQARFGFDPALGGDAPALADGQQMVVTAGSGTYSVRSRARLENGAWTELDTAVRLGGVPVSGLAFSVLRWQDGAQP
jgi:general secretion pathway protein K